MTRVRFLRAAVRFRRWKRRPGVETALRRLRRGAPYAASIAFNLGLIVLLAIGYTSFVARGIVDGGPGERVVSVQLFESVPSPERKPEVQADESEEPEEAELGAETLPEGNAAAAGELSGEIRGEDAPEEEKGEETTVARAGVSIPSVALPDVDPGEGRPDGIVGVDCYNVFADDREKALECAGRDILSGWRAEYADLSNEWARFADELGTARRTIRYGPLRAPVDPAVYGYPSGLAVPPEVQKRYEAAVAELRRRQQIEEFGRTSEVEKEKREELRRDQEAATYEPVSPGGS